MIRPNRRSRPLVLLLAASLLAAGAVASLPALAAAPGGNVIVNPGFETPPTYDPDGNPSIPAGWTTLSAPSGASSNPNDLCYNSNGGYPASSEGPATGGIRFYFPGFDGDVTLYQDVAVTPSDVQGKTLRIGGQFGGYLSQDDASTLNVNYLSATSTVLGTLSTTAVTAADRTSNTSFVSRDATGTVPAGTARLRVAIVSHRTDGSANDGYVDNVYATFDASAPAPVSPSTNTACPNSTAPTSTPSPTATPSPTQTATPAPTATATPPADPTVGKPTVCRAIRGVGRDKSLVAPGGGRLTLVTRRSDDALTPIGLSVKAKGGAKVKSVKYTLNGKALASGAIDTALLRTGANKVRAVVKLRNGKQVTFRRRFSVGACQVSPVTCVRSGARATCTSTALPRVRKVKVTLIGATVTASGTAKTKNGRLSIVVTAPSNLPAGRYLFKQIATTTRKGEKIATVRAVDLS